MHNFDIEKYINGEMKGDELESFESRLKLDPGLQSEVNHTKELIEGLRQLGLSEKIIHAQQRNRWLKWFRWIALPGLISLAIFYFSTMNGALDTGKIPTEVILAPGDNNKAFLLKDSLETNSKEPLRDSLLKEQDTLQNEPAIFAWEDPRAAKEMADYYYSTPEYFSYARGNSAESLIDSAKMEFNAEAYTNALLYLQKLTTAPFEKTYFEALCYFKLGNYTKAGNLFKLALSKNSDSQKSMDIEWYTFLNALACGKPCNQEFTKLSQSIQKNSNHLYSKQVQLILNKKHVRRKYK